MKQMVIFTRLSVKQHKFIVIGYQLNYLYLFDVLPSILKIDHFIVNL